MHGTFAMDFPSIEPLLNIQDYMSNADVPGIFP